MLGALGIMNILVLGIMEFQPVGCEELIVVSNPTSRRCTGMRFNDCVIYFLFCGIQSLFIATGSYKHG